MARAIELDDMDRVYDIAFHHSSNEVQNYISKRFNDFVSVVRDTGDNFVTGLINSYQEGVENRKINLGELMKQRVGSIFQTDIIRPLNTINEIQQAPDTMKRWVMAHPVMRDRYLNGSVSGYDNAFVNNYPNQNSGTSHFDYRRVMDGVIQNVNDKCISTQFIETVCDVDRLITSEKAIMKRVWSVIDQSIQDGSNSDPSSVWDGTM